MELFSSPGRTELGGNHTDHQRGRVLAAAVSLDILACAAPNGEGRVRFISEGWPALELDLAEPGPIEAERGSPAALIRGVAGALRGPGRPLGGFDAYAASVLPAGAGLSSSAAFELLAAQIFNSFYCAGELDALCLALAAQRAENEYFGKPCGLMDQLACALGGAAALDFAGPAGPEVTRLPFAPGRHGFALCLIHTGSGHAGLTEEYAAVPREMRAVAAFFGREALRGLEEAELLAAAPELRRAVGDRALLRALHFIREDARAALQAEALLRGDFPAFLDLVRESARSSRELLQNIFPAGAVIRTAPGPGARPRGGLAGRRGRGPRPRRRLCRGRAGLCPAGRGWRASRGAWTPYSAPAPAGRWRYAGGARGRCGRNSKAPGAAPALFAASICSCSAPPSPRSRGSGRCAWPCPRGRTPGRDPAPPW